MRVTDRSIALLGRGDAVPGSDGLVTLYPHTVTHPILSCCDDEKVEYEVSSRAGRSRSTPGVHRRSSPIRTVGCRISTTARRRALRRNGIRWALADEPGFAGPDSDPYELPRLGLTTESFAQFRLKVSGFAGGRARTRAWPGGSPRRPATGERQEVSA